MELVRNDFPRYWMPIQWIFSISLDLTERGKISAGMMDAILQETKAYREVFQTIQIIDSKNFNCTKFEFEILYNFLKYISETPIVAQL
jgi:hypothetical protein